MATYKVIQDIEAEDKLVGPLSFRQFVYGLISVFMLYLSFIFITKHVPFLLIMTLPPALFTGFFAFPFGKDQPTEVWALAKIRFYFKPRRRIWDQSGVKELVTVTVPKKIERVLTNGLNQDEVASRLEALANTIDSRGWAVKNVNVNLYSQPDQITSTTTDRLIDPNSMPQEVPNYSINAADDILDEQSNPIAQQFDHMINASSQAHRQQLVDQMNDTQQPPASPGTGALAPPADYWFMNQPAAPLAADQTMFASQSVVQPGTSDEPATVAHAAAPTADESALIAKFKEQRNSQQVSYSHMRTLQPIGSQPATPAAVPQLDEPQLAPQTDAAAVTPQRDAAILSLAQNDDLNIATLARQAQKAQDEGTLSNGPDDEVVISFH